MPEVRIVTDEWWPVYTVDDSSLGVKADVDQGTLLRWERALDTFREVQEEMAQVVSDELEAGRGF